MSLLEEKAINQITVRELTDLVDINRGTFYFHYNDIYNMLHSVEDDFLSRFQLVPDQEIVSGTGSFPYLLNVFGFIKKNSDIMTIMLGKNTDVDFANRLKKMFFERCEKHWREKMGITDDTELATYSAFLVAGSVGIIKMWLNNGMKESVEEISHLAGTIMEASLKPYFH